jgi:hypothetical protein
LFSGLLSTSAPLLKSTRPLCLNRT